MRLSGSIVPVSTEPSNRKSGWRTRYWFTGVEFATSTANDNPSLRPARPICCIALAIVPG